MTKPTDREALGKLVLLVYCLAQDEDAHGEWPKHAREVLENIGISKAEEIPALFTQDPAREVEMLPRIEAVSIIQRAQKRCSPGSTDCPVRLIRGVPFSKIEEEEMSDSLQRACAAKWGLKIKEPK